MQIHKATIGVPLSKDGFGALVIQWSPESEPSLQAVPSADVVAWKDVEAPVAPKQHVFRRPASDATQFVQPCLKGIVVKPIESVQVHVVSLYGGCNPDNGGALAAAETKRAQ
jgi:hypothetical protein